MEEIILKSKKYWRSAGRTGLGHYIAAEMYAKRHRKIGIPSVVLSTIVATSIFSTLSESVDIKLRIATGVIALLAAIFASLQAFLAFGERADKHRAAGARYGKIRRDIDMFQLKLKFKSKGSDEHWEEALKQLEIIGNEFSSLAIDYPSLSELIYAKAKSDFNNENPKE